MKFVIDENNDKDDNVKVKRDVWIRTNKIN